MHVISKNSLSDFYATHPRAEEPLLAWYRIVDKSNFNNFAELRNTFNSVDHVKGFHAFNIAGNNFRVICAIHFNTHKIYIRHVFTHTQYDDWRPQ